MSSDAPHIQIPATRTLKQGQTGHGEHCPRPVNATRHLPHYHNCHQRQARNGDLRKSRTAPSVPSSTLIAPPFCNTLVSGLHSAASRRVIGRKRASNSAQHTFVHSAPHLRLLRNTPHLRSLDYAPLALCIFCCLLLPSTSIMIIKFTRTNRTSGNIS